MEDNKFTMNHETIQNSIKKQIKKLVLLQQIEKQCSYDDAVEDVVDFLVCAVKELGNK